MVELIPNGVYLKNGKTIVNDAAGMPSADEARENTIAYRILRAHDVDGSKGKKMRIKFDAMASHDITYVGIIQTARASGLDKFPIPYAMTNCHNSLCAVGGTINEDDHIFGLSAAKKYGGIYVPANQAVIHQYVREALAGCGRMILGSDSHTRYGALGTMAMGEGGPELVKQLLNQTYDINMPGVVAVYLKGAPVKGVGPQDVALAIIGEVFANGYVKNKVMEFVGPGVASLSADFRIGVDVMTTETTCLSSIWRTDEKIKEFYDIHGRSEDYKELNPGNVAYYDGMIEIDLGQIKPMIAMPFHPSNTYEIDELRSNLGDILRQVEKEGYRWAQLGIFDQNSAAVYLKKWAERNRKYTSYLSNLRILNRPPVEAERRYIDQWMDMGFPPETVALAYERTVFYKKDLNWRYLNGILRRWHDAGWHTPRQVEEGEAAGKRPAAAGKSAAPAGDKDAWMRRYIKR